MSKIIKILGTGCPKCKTTSNLVSEVIKENNIDAILIKVEDIMQIMEYNVLSTPAVVIDEEVKIKGRVPSKNEIIELLQNGTSDSSDSSESSCCSTDSCC